MSRSLRFEEDGAQRFAGALGEPELLAIEAALGEPPPGRPGVRFGASAALARLVDGDALPCRIASALLGRGCRPVRAVLFDKSPGANWSLAWRQDRTIVAKARRDVEGFGPWSLKRGLRLSP